MDIQFSHSTLGYLIRKKFDSVTDSYGRGNKKLSWRDRNRNRCNECRRESRQNNPELHNRYKCEYRYRHPQKSRAHYNLTDAIRRSKIERPNQCTICGKLCTPEGHHPDYSKPLDVVWACRDCHKSLHIQLDKLDELFSLSLSEPMRPVSHVYHSYPAGVSAHLNKEVENV